MNVEKLADELAERIRAIFKRNSVEGCITGPLSDGQRYIVLSYDDYAAHLQNRQARGRKEAAEALSRQKAAGEAMKEALGMVPLRGRSEDLGAFDARQAAWLRDYHDPALTAWNSIEQGVGG